MQLFSHQDILDQIPPATDDAGEERRIEQALRIEANINDGASFSENFMTAYWNEIDSFIQEDIASSNAEDDAK